VENLIWYVLLVASLFAGFSWYVAGERGRDQGSWLVLGALFGPLALFAVGVIPAIPTVSPGKTRECPTCGEVIKIQAQACKHCCRDVEPLEEGGA